MNNELINRVFYKNRLKLKYKNFIEFSTSNYFDKYINCYKEIEEKYYIQYNRYIDYKMLYHLDKYNIKKLSDKFKNAYKDQLISAKMMYDDDEEIYKMMENIISL